MNYKLLLLGLFTASIVSCSTAYKAGQTPDDVYYSPAKEMVAKKETKKDQYEDYARNEDDQYLRMKVRNRDRWSTIDDHEYWYDSRYDHCLCNYNYRNQYSWNNWRYNVYGRPGWNDYYYNGWHPGWGTGYGYGYPVIVNNYVPKASNVNRPALGGYKNNSGYNNNNSNLGNTIRKVFTPSTSTYNNSNNGNSNSNTNSSPSRTYNPSSSGSSSSGSSSSSSGGGVSRPSRGGN